MLPGILRARSRASTQRGKIIMRPSIKVSLTGLLIAGALACSADAMGAASGNSNGPDAFIGIVGGNPGASVGGIPYNRGIYPGGGYQANFGRIYHNDHGGNGAYDGGPDH
jgi:hypothetical protein